MTHFNSLLDNRAIIALTGPDRKSFLQGLVTNNMDHLDGQDAIYTALLTPQGKYLFDFFLTEQDEILYLDCESPRVADLTRRLMMYRLRADVDIADVSDKYVVTVSDQKKSEALISFKDPRHSGLGYRNILEKDSCDASEDSTPYNHLRISLGVPDGSKDHQVDKTFILEGNIDELNGVDFTKGCYVGQEMTARMKHRGRLKKRLVPVQLSGPAPEEFTAIVNENGKQIGDLRSSVKDQAIAYLRLDEFEFDKEYDCGTVKVIPQKPDWWPPTSGDSP